MNSSTRPSRPFAPRMYATVVLLIMVLPLLGATPPVALGRFGDPTETATESIRTAERSPEERPDVRQTPTPTRTETPTPAAGRAAKPRPIDVSAEGVIRGGSRPGVAGERYIVMFREDVPDPEGLALQLEADLGLNVSHVYRHALKGFAATMPRNAVAALERHPLVVAVEPDPIVRLEQQQLPTGIDRIEVDGNATARIDGVGQRINVDVAVLDTGIDPTHPDLTVVHAADCVESGTDWDDDNGHGTHVAGTIGAKDNGIGVVGVAPGARLWAVKVLDGDGVDGDGFFSGSSVLCGLDYVADHAREIEVVNMSLSGSGFEIGRCGFHPQIPDFQHVAICKIVRAGVTVVVAAGNQCQDASVRVPAAYDEVITVSALLDSDGRPGALGISGGSDCKRNGASVFTPDDGLAAFSNFGADVDIAAPGVDILSTYPRHLEASGYASRSGTSMAAPHVAGAAALYMSTHPNASPGAVKRALLAVREQVHMPEDSDGIDEGILNVNTDRTPAALRLVTIEEFEPDEFFSFSESTLWYGPAFDRQGEFTVRIATNDPESGVRDAAWPSAFSTQSGVSDAPLDPVSGVRPRKHEFSRTYRWFGEAASVTKEVRVGNGVGAAAGVRFSARLDDRAPSIAFTSPAAGAPVPKQVVLKVDARDTFGGLVQRRGSGVVSVSFGYCREGTDCEWGKPSLTGVGTDATAPYSATWDNSRLPDGAYTLMATAKDKVGNVSYATPVLIFKDSSRPAVTITAPLAGSTVERNTTIDVDAVDAGSGVAEVVVRLCPRRSSITGGHCTGGSTIIGRDTTAPFSVAWRAPANGVYKLQAEATDHVGNVNWSPITSVTVGDGPPPPTDTTPPTVPMLTVGESEPDLYVIQVVDNQEVVTAITYDPTSGSQKTFTVLAETADPESGIAAVTFPPLFRPSGEDEVDRQAPYKITRTLGANLAGSVNARITATNRDGLTTDSGRLFIVPDSAAPSVAFAPPLPSQVTAGQTILVEANDDRQRPQEGLARLRTIETRFCPGTSCAFNRGTSLGVVTPPLNQVGWTAEFAWPSGRPAGPYTLVARATDNLGHDADSAPVTVEATDAGRAAEAPRGTAAADRNGNGDAPAVGPVVTLTAPAAGSTLAGEAALVAKVTDKGDLTIVKVVFEVRESGGEWTAIGQPDRAAPYKHRFTTKDRAPGSYELRAVAFDKKGKATPSAAVAVEVASPPPEANSDAAADAEADPTSAAAPARKHRQRNGR